MNEFHESIGTAINWLLGSKIHNLDEANTETFGSFNNYYDLNKKSCAFAYTEITAYAIQLLLDLYRRTNDKKYLENAELASEWILGMQYTGSDENATGGFLECLYLPNGPVGERAYSFDAAICIGALSDLYRETGNNRYLRSARQGSRWLSQVMRNFDGSFKPFYKLETKRFSENRRRWSAILGNAWHKLAGCHHSKIAIGLLKYCSVENDTFTLEIVKSLSHWALAQQDPKGYFRVNPQRKACFLHAHCYAAEALLYSYRYLKDEQLFEVGKRAADWLVEIQRSDGSIPSWFNNGQIISYVDSSAVAQAIRLWSILYSETGDRRYCDSMKKALRYLISMQCMDSDLGALGGFYMIEFDFKLLKYRLHRLYSWATIFAIHALFLAEDVSSRKIEMSELW